MSGRDREGERKRITDDVSKEQLTSKPRFLSCLGNELGGNPFTVRVVSGMQVTRARSAAFVRNRRRHVRIRPRLKEARREGAPQAESLREGLSTEAGCAGGPARSSGEALVIGVERRGRIARDEFMRSTRNIRGGIVWVS